VTRAFTSSIRIYLLRDFGWFGRLSNKVATSQLALPKATCDLVCATAGYEQSITNLSRTSLATDNVFSDGASLEIPSIAGDVTGGFVALSA
jgi:hypothetical protein